MIDKQINTLYHNNNLKIDFFKINTKKKISTTLFNESLNEKEEKRKSSKGIIVIVILTP